ncbi:hypothetical protein GCM10007858_38770 [Bradyrhizobium liaoningense]|nr:hypothetical protein GCM10007858_38770 [Bradyrhizobium liaoningense]
MVPRYSEGNAVRGGRHFARPVPGIHPSERSASLKVSPQRDTRRTAAASSASPRAETPTTGTVSRSNPSGSGTSSSGGKDDNGDAGRDKMPESDRTVRPQSQQHHPNDK